MRRILLKLHLWLALASAVVVLVVSATGCLLVFELTMDRWLDPQAFAVRAHGPALPIAELARRVHDGFPGRALTQVNLFGADAPAEFRLRGAIRVYVEPHTGAITGVRSGEPPSYWVRHVHREMAAGKAGEAIVRGASVIVLYQCLSGIWLWWPGKRVKVKWNVSWRKANLDVHHAAGILASVPLCILAATGLVKSFGDRIQPLVEEITGKPAAVRAMTSQRPAAGQVQGIGLDEALATARRVLPGATPARITPPKSATDPITITLKFPGDSTAPGRSWVVLDRYSGQVLAMQDARHAPAAAELPIVNRAIHVGGIAGAPSRIAVFAASLALLVQVVTGILIWWGRRTARSRPVRVPEALASRNG